MSTIDKIVVGCAVLALALLGFWLWLKGHDERIRLEAKVAQLEEQNKRDKAETEALKAEQNKKAEQVRSKPAAMGDFIAQEVPFKIEQLPGKTPDPMAAPEIRIAPTETPKFFEYTNSCKLCEIKLAGAEKEIANLTEQNEELKKHGKPSFGKRFGNCLLRGGIGAAPGALARNKAQSIGGAALGIGTCFIWRD